MRGCERRMQELSGAEIFAHGILYCLTTITAILINTGCTTTRPNKFQREAIPNIAQIHARLEQYNRHHPEFPKIDSCPAEKTMYGEMSSGMRRADWQGDCTELWMLVGWKPAGKVLCSYDVMIGVSRFGIDFDYEVTAFCPTVGLVTGYMFRSYRGHETIYEDFVFPGIIEGDVIIEHKLPVIDDDTE